MSGFNERNNEDRRGLQLVHGVTAGSSAFTLLRGQLRWFREQGWDVTLVCDGSEAGQSAARREGVALQSIPMQREIAPLHDLRALASWVRFLLRKKPDALVVGTPKASLLGSIAGFLLRVPRRVYLVRGLRLEGASGWRARLLWLTERLTMLCSTDVVYVSASLAAACEGLGLRHRRDNWLIGAGSSNGVDAAAVHARASQVDRRALRDSLGLAEEDFVVGFVGRIAADKGVEVLLRALLRDDMPSNIKVLLVGRDEQGGALPELDAAGDRVVKLGWTSDVWGVLPAMDVLCLPSRREGFPNVVLEAGAAGLPVVTTRATGCIDSVVDGETGLLFDVDDVDGLATALLRLEGDRTFAQQLGSAGRTRTIRDFAPEKVWQGLMDILRGTTEGSDVVHRAPQEGKQKKGSRT